MAQQLCEFSEEHLKTCATSKAELENIMDWEEKFIADALVSKLNASINLAAAKAPQEIKSNLVGLQEALLGFNEAADGAYKDIMKKLDATTRRTITADDDCLNNLRRLKQTNTLGLIPCSVADKFKAIATEFKCAVNRKYQYAKQKIMPIWELINRKVEVLADELKVDVNKCKAQIIINASRLQRNSINFGNPNAAREINDFIRRISFDALEANNQFEGLNEVIKRSAPGIAV